MTSMSSILINLEELNQIFMVLGTMRSFPQLPRHNAHLAHSLVDSGWSCSAVISGLIDGANYLAEQLANILIDKVFPT
jgi:hypothetical protein